SHRADGRLGAPRLPGREPVPQHGQVRERQARGLYEAALEEVSLTPASWLFAASIALATAITWRRPGSRAWTLALVVGLIVTVAIADTRRAPRIFPLADIAVLEIYVRNALTGSLLVGPYSRFGWHHPGPLYFYLIAPLYPAAGSQAIAMAAGAAMLF